MNEKTAEKVSSSSEKKVRPFRTSIVEVDEEALSILSAEKGEDVLGEGDERLEMELRSNPTRAMVERWLKHPDERVALHFLRRVENPGLFPHGVIAEREVAKLLVERSDREGLLWTPLLDDLALSGYWDKREHLQRAEMLEEYLKSEQEVQVIHELMRFKDPVLQEVVRRHARILDASLVIEWSRDVKNLAALAQNPGLSVRQRELVFLRTFQALTSAPEAKEAYHCFSVSGYEIPDELFERIFREERAEKADRIDVQGPHPLHHIYQALLYYAPLTAEQMDEIVPVMDRRAASLWAEVIRRPYSKREHWLRALEMGAEHSGVQKALARHPEARKDPEIRRHLIRWGGGPFGYFVLQEMTEVLSREEIKPFLTAMQAENNSDIAIKWLSSGAFPEWMRASDLAPFCASENSEVRLAAIQAISRLPSSPGRSVKEGDEQKRVRR